MFVFEWISWFILRLTLRLIFDEFEWYFFFVSVWRFFFDDVAGTAEKNVDVDEIFDDDLFLCLRMFLYLTACLISDLVYNSFFVWTSSFWITALFFECSSDFTFFWNTFRFVFEFRTSFSCISVFFTIAYFHWLFVQNFAIFFVFRKCQSEYFLNMKFTDHRKWRSSPFNDDLIACHVR